MDRGIMSRYFRFFIIIFLGIITTLKAADTDKFNPIIKQHKDFLVEQRAAMEQPEAALRALLNKPIAKETRARFGELKVQLEVQEKRVRHNRGIFTEQSRGIMFFINNARRKQEVDVRQTLGENAHKNQHKTVPVCSDDQSSIEQELKDLDKQYDQLEEAYWELTKHESFSGFQQSIALQKSLENQGSSSWAPLLLGMGTLFVGFCVFNYLAHLNISEWFFQHNIV